MGSFLPPSLMVWRWIPWKRKRNCPACGDDTMRVNAPFLLRSVELLGIPYRSCRRCPWAGFDLAGSGSYGQETESTPVGGEISLEEWTRAAAIGQESATAGPAGAAAQAPEATEPEAVPELPTEPESAEKTDPNASAAGASAGHAGPRRPQNKHGGEKTSNRRGHRGKQPPIRPPTRPNASET